MLSNDLRSQVSSTSRLCLATAGLAALAHAGETNALSLRPRGAYVASDPNHAVFKSGSEYHFRYTDGAVVREYVVDMSSPNVIEGMLEVKELASQSYPIFEGGLTWRHGGERWSPLDLSTKSIVTLLHEHLDIRAEMLTLKYRDEVDHDGNTSTPRIPAAKTYEFRLVGKVLRIRAYADNSLRSLFNDNYYYLRPGRSKGTTVVREQHIPYMDNAIVCAFQQPGETPLFYSLLLDYYASNGSLDASAIVPPTDPVPTGSYEHFYPMVTLPSSDGALSGDPQVLAPVDDTLNLILTAHIEDTFPVPPNYRSPYYKLCSGRMEVLGGRDSYYAWFDYQKQYELFAEVGLTDLNIQQFSTLTYPGAILLPTVGVPSPLSCTPTTLNSVAPDIDPATNLRIVDLADPVLGPDIESKTNIEFLEMTDAARKTGALFAHMVAQPDMDVWDGPAGQYEQGAIACPPAPYPTARALGIRNLDYPYTYGEGFGMRVPDVNPNFDDDIAIHDQFGARKPGWDSHALLQGTSWDPDWDDGDGVEDECPAGFAEALVSASAMTPFLEKQLAYGRAHFAPNCVRVDVLSGVAGDLQIDQVAGSPRTHTAAEMWQQRSRTFRTMRSYIGGPLYGEGYYWRAATNYDHGLRDGHPFAFPAFEDVNADGFGNEEGFVIPNYNLTEVLAKASGHSGVGQEFGHRWPAAVSFPIDGVLGDDSSFLDSWLTTIATYGNNAYLSSSGHFQQPYWTYQGILRSYFTINGLARRIRESKLTSVEYVDDSGAFKQLGDAIMLGLDLRNPRVRIQWSTPGGGTLVLYANHSYNTYPDWNVVVPVPGGGTESLALPRNGFAAGDGSKLLVFFNAKPSGYAEYFDYAEQVNIHKMLNARRPIAWTAPQIDYRGFPSELSSGFSPSDAALVASGMVARSYFSTRAVGAAGGVWNRFVEPATWYTDPETLQTGKVVFSGLMPAAVPTGLHLETDASSLRINKTEGFVAIAEYDTGATRDVTGLVAWDCDSPDCGWSVSSALASVNASGGVTAKALGPSVTVTAKWAGMTASLGGLEIVDGLPSGTPTITSSGYAGETAKLAVPDALDPKGGNVDVRWQLGDGSASERGRVVSHTYHKPGTYSVATTLGDVEENERALTTNAAVSSSSSILWGDDFDDGVLDGWNLNGGEWWGVIGGALHQGESLPVATYRQATIAGEVFPLSASFGAEFRMRNLGAVGTRAAGLHVRKLTESDAPLVSGYSVIVKPNGMIAIQEPGTNNPPPPTPTVTGFSSAVPHDLRVVTKQAAATAPANVLVFVDGVQYIDWTDTTPPSAGYTSVTSLNQEPDFDNVRVHEYRAPYVAASPLSLNGFSSTMSTIYIDDQDTVSDFSETNLELDVVQEFAGGATQTTHYSSATTPAISTLFGTWTTDPNGTTRSGPMTTSIETLRGTAPYVRLEFTISDNGGRVGRRVFRY